MQNLDAEAIWKLKDFELVGLLESRQYTSTGKEIRFYAPSFSYYKTKYYCSSPTSFPTISVTGTACSLNCKHCGGKVLETMQPTLQPEELFNLCKRLKQNGAEGCLISGGCLPDGSVPLEKFVNSIGRVKRELGLTIFVHTGIIKPQTASALKEASVDAALIDVLGSQETIRSMLNLKVSTEDYADSLHALQDAGLSFVPHIIVGLNGGRLDGELTALKMIGEVNPSALVVIAFMPIHGTEMEKTLPPKPTDIAKVSAAARLMFPKTPLILGCMRPKGKARSETDVLSLKAGVDAIAFPSEEAIKYVESRGWKTAFSSYCCAQMYIDSLKNWK